MEFNPGTENAKSSLLNQPLGNLIDANDAVSAVAIFSLQDRLAAVVQHVHRAAKDRKISSDCVHDLRVATRRALAAIKLYRELLPAKLSKSLMRMLKVLLSNAGKTRDLDVLTRRFEKAENSNARQLVKGLRKYRARKQRRLSKLCSEMRDNDRLTRRIAQLLSTFEGANSATEPIGIWANARWLELVNDFAAISNADHSKLELLHRFRIRTKGLRYTIELLGSTFNQELLPPTHGALKELQERLGDIHDQSVAIQLFRRWNRKGHAISKKCNLKAPKRVACSQLKQAIAEFRTRWTPTVKADLLQSLTKLADSSTASYVQ